MATQNPISTISYNTELFLKEKLDTWYKAHIISCYQYIFHKGEDGDKDHFHVRVEPNKRLDPMNLQEELREYQIGSDKPLGCRPFRISKEEDWFLYAVHDETYLKLKYGGGEKYEKLPYDWHDIRVPDDYDCEIAFIRAKAYLEHTSVNMAARLRNGDNPLDLVLEGENVFTVNALTRALSGSDYNRVTSELKSVRDKLDGILSAIDAFGLAVEVDADGNYFLSPCPGFSSAEELEF